MKLKKLASLLIAGAMIFSMAMPAFALGSTTSGSSGNDAAASGGSDAVASTSDLSRSLKFEGLTKVPTVKVTMPATSQIILNPFGLKVGDDESTDEFISETVYLVNESDCKIAVSGTITPTVTGATKLVDAPSKADTGTDAKLAPNNVFVAMAITEVADADTELDFVDGLTYSSTARGVATGTAATTYLGKMLGATTTATNYLKGKVPAADYGFYIMKTADTAVKFGDSTDAAKFTPPATGTGTATASKLPYVLNAGDENPTYLGFRLFGLCETKVATPWAAADTVSVTMALTLVPYAN